MKLFLPVVILCALWLSPVSARIGETEAQIETRYGKKITAMDLAYGRSWVYGHAGMVIVVTYREGLTALEMYSKQDKTAFTDTEIGVFMKANGGDRFVWMEEESNDRGVIRWRRAGPGMIMTYPRDRRSLFLCTEQIWKETGQKVIDREKEKLKDI